MKVAPYIIPFALMGVFMLDSCKKDICLDCSDSVNPTEPFQTTPYNLQYPDHFIIPTLSEENPLTEEGIALGRKLFYDASWTNGGGTSCNSCHQQELAFSVAGTCIADVNGTTVPRDIMPLINLAWKNSFAWDGREPTLEEKIIGSIENPFTMDTSDSLLTANLSAQDDYVQLFNDAFGSADSINTKNVAFALSQFIQTFVSGNSRYDEFLLSGQQPIQFFTPEEFEGYIIYNTEVGDCFHCHGSTLLTDDDWHNNGLDETLTDLGLGATTGNSNDNGKFKTNTLRNIEFTAPYMHDGRYATLEEVVEFYSFGVQAASPNIDPLMKKAQQGGIGLTASERQSLVAFLKTFSDPSFLSNPDFEE